MQRTVKSTKFTYATNKLNENGELSARLETIEVHESDEKKALRKAFKEVGAFTPLKVEKIDSLYVLDDEIFFQYAEKVEV